MLAETTAMHKAIELAIGCCFLSGDFEINNQTIDRMINEYGNPITP